MPHASRSGRSRRLRSRTLAIQIFSVVLAFVVGLCVYLQKTEAEAAPPAARAAMSATDAGDAPGPAMAAAAAPGTAADAGADAESPIDIAIAPDGGVPFHPQGTKYRSPFAKPNAGPAVRAKV